MKKLSLEMLQLTSEEVLGRNQMKKITGGRRYSCQCTMGPGSWTANYSSDEQAWLALGEWCEGGAGTCSGAVA
jgi:hypothetical protein